MSSTKMKKMIGDVVKVSRKHILRVHKKSKSLEEHSLIGRDQPLSDAKTITKNNREVSIVIPKGFLALYVGPNHRRFLVPTRFLSIPDFRAVMDRAAEEFGYEQQGGLRIPCDEDDFDKLLAYCKLKCKISNSNSSNYYFPTHCFYDKTITV